MAEAAYRTAKVERGQQQERRPPLRQSRLQRALKVTAVVLGGLVLLLTLALLGLNVFEDRIRGYVEQQLNSRIPGYHFTIGRLDLHPLGLSLDVEDLRVAQAEHPDPPMASIPLWHASVQWGHLLKGDIVSDLRLDRPVVHLTRSRAKEGGKDAQETAQSVAQQEKKRWQETVTAIYPVTVNEFKLENGDVTYVDTPAASPLRVTDLKIRIENIRNVRSEPGSYPSPMTIEARLGGGGRIAVDGRADLLAAPWPNIHADLRFEELDLGQLLPLAAPYHLQLRAGTVTAEGHLQTAPDLRLMKLSQATLENVRLDYIHTAKASLAQKAGEKAAEAGTVDPKKQTGPETVVKIVKGQIRNGEFGVVDKTATPQYRVHLADVNAQLTNLSNQLKEGTGFITLSGKFMGSGDLQLTGTFRPETKSPDFDLNLKIENTRLPAMNNLLRAYGKLDLARGRFSLYTELSVRDGQVQGYIKPLLQDMDVYDGRQDKDKPVLKKLYEGVVGGVAGLLQSDETDAVATKTELSGRLENPKANNWEALAAVLRNAFIRAVLPGFDGVAR